MDDPQSVDVISTPSSPTQEHLPFSSPALMPPDSLTSDALRERFPNDRQCLNAVSTPPFPTQEHIPAPPPTSPDRPPLSDHIRELPTGDQCGPTTNTLFSSTQEHLPTSRSSPLHLLTPPKKLHPMLSCWIKNMNKLSSLIECLQGLASSTPAEHRSRLLNQVVALRMTSRKQQEHFMEFLQLSEEYADKYLLNISAEIQQQSTFLDNLEEHLEAAKKLHREAVDLKMLYKSRTVVIMEHLRVTGKATPLSSPESKY
jgi:hypothetical protein